VNAASFTSLQLLQILRARGWN